MLLIEQSIFGQRRIARTSEHVLVEAPMIHLTDLVEGMPAITPAFGRYLAEAGAVCLESQGHSQGQHLAVNGAQGQSGSYSVTWPAVTEQSALRSC